MVFHNTVMRPTTGWRTVRGRPDDKAPVVKFVGHPSTLTPSGYLTLAAYHFARHGLSRVLLKSLSEIEFTDIPARESLLPPLQRGSRTQQ
jgi:hypothetical protein